MQKEDQAIPDARLDIKTRMAGDRVELVFRDTGPGISPESLERIFDPLFSTKNFGVGLGLTLAKETMESHGGGIDIECPADGGTRVTLWLPMRPPIDASETV